MNMNIHSAAWQRLRRYVLMQEPWCPDPYKRHPYTRVRADSVDHIVPRSAGGSDARANLRGLCRGCNSAKAMREEGARSWR